MRTGADDFDYASPTVPAGAVFVAGEEPLLVFPSARAAERGINVIEAENGVYSAAYGPQGEPYRVARKGKRVIVERTGEASRPEDLRVLLLGYLESREQTPDAAAGMSELIQQVWRCESAFWQEYDPCGDRFTKPVPTSCCVAVVLAPATLLYALIARDWMAIPFVIVMTSLIGGIAALAKRKADRLDFRQR